MDFSPEVRFGAYINEALCSIRAGKAGGIGDQVHLQAISLVHNNLKNGS